MEDYVKGSIQSNCEQKALAYRSNGGIADLTDGGRRDCVASLQRQECRVNRSSKNFPTFSHIHIDSAVFDSKAAMFMKKKLTHSCCSPLYYHSSPLPSPGVRGVTFPSSFRHRLNSPPPF